MVARSAEAAIAEAEWLVGVDVGGTFTDLYAFDRASGELARHKCPSTPENPAKAILSGLATLFHAARIEPASVRTLAHGTTVATNALIQRGGARVAVVTTRHFRDLLEIGRQIRPHLYDLKADQAPPLAHREHRFEVDERIGAGGEVVTALDDASVAAAIESIEGSGAEACAVCLLFSYLNADHEQAVARRIRDALPDIALSVSSDVQPEFREFERFSTTVLNAYLQPLLERYMRELEEEIERLAPRVRLGINQSSGGLMSPRRAREHPIRTALSGPAAGVTGALNVARLADRANVITLDVGGTSADVALIRDHAIGVAFDRAVAGFPVRLPMVDIDTVGAGGGSVAWFEKDGLLKVGPRSAGAVPGPACYGQGGTEPTVTDANLVLGRLAGKGLLGGAMRLDEAAARDALRPVAERLGFTLERTALGMLEIMTANMVRSIRTMSVERGHDPRDFVLMPFGGAGPLHANACARALGIVEIVVPSFPGILCAEGLLVADLSESFVRSQRFRAAEENSGTMSALIASLLEEAARFWSDEDIGPAERSLKVLVDMRYASQNYELQVPLTVEGGVPVEPDMRELRERFYAEHDRAYGFHNPTDPVDVIAIRLTAVGKLASPAAPRAGDDASTSPEPVGHRGVWFDGSGPRPTPVYERTALAPGATLAGPAVIEQFDATTLVFPDESARVDGALNVLVRHKQEDRP